MSDKYYLTDCNTQGYHCCSNSYTMTRQPNRSYEENKQLEVDVKAPPKTNWWQRLWERDVQRAQS